jgi:hypothetical protein
MDEHDRVRRPPQETLPMLTTEHFTLQTERSSASSDTNARLQLYMSVLTSSIIALALAAQVSDVGSVFRGLALVLLPTVYVVGLVTLGRMRQLWQAWFAASQGMNRIRHFFVEMAPETAPYFVMPTTDEPWTTLQGHGIGRGADVSGREGLYTAPAAVGIVNSMVAAAFVGILTASLTDGSTLLPAILGAAAFALSFIALMISGIRGFQRRMTSSEVRFPPES